MENSTERAGGYHWDWKLFFSILLYMSVPPLYQSYSLYLIGNTPPQENNLGVLSQWQFIQIALEVIQEVFVFPLYFFVGRQWRQSKAAVSQSIRSGAAYLLLILCPFALLSIWGMGLVLDQISADESIRASALLFLRLKTAAAVVGIFNTALIVITESLRRTRLILGILFLKLLFSLTFDSWLFGGYNFSLGLGVEGVAISNILTELLLLFIVGGYFKKNSGIPLKEYFTLPPRPTFHVLKGISQWIAVESIIRNGVYFFMILKLINALGPKHIGGYYLAMHLFWSLALVPVMALAETMKVLFANFASDVETIKKTLKTGLSLSLFILAGWLATMPMVSPALLFFSNDPDLINNAHQAVQMLVLPYMLLALNILADSLFIGLGKTKYLALQSIYTNLGVYGMAFLLYIQGLWAPTFSNILILFGIGIAVDSIFTFAYARLVIKQCEKKMYKELDIP